MAAIHLMNLGSHIASTSGPKVALWRLRNGKEKRLPGLKANALDRLVAVGKIREIDREHVTFIVRTIVHPPERADN
ncbi:MAG: hypothetical protein WBE89_08980 [Methyloceanibacter sp.]